MEMVYGPRTARGALYVKNVYWLQLLKRLLIRRCPFPDTGGSRSHAIPVAGHDIDSALNCPLMDQCGFKFVRKDVSDNSLDLNLTSNAVWMTSSAQIPS